MTPDQIAQAAEIIADSWRENKTIERLSGELRPQDQKTAVAIQDELARLIGHKVVGWKVGGQMPGPFLIGRIFEPNLLNSPAALPEKQYGHPNGIAEAELGFRVLSGLPARSAAYSADELAEHVVLVPTFEIAGTRFSGESLDSEVEADFLQMYAHNGSCIGVVVGDDIEDWREMSLLDVELIVDGSPVPNVPLENRRQPLKVLDILVLLANDLSQRGIGLEAGQVTTLGAAANAPMGRELIATFGDHSRIEARITSP